MDDFPTTPKTRALQRRTVVRRLWLCGFTLAIAIVQMTLSLTAREGGFFANFSPLLLLVGSLLGLVNDLHRLQIMRSEEHLAHWCGKPFLDPATELQAFAGKLDAQSGRP